jgi:hypothetical protein
MFVPFESLSPASRIWVYQSNRKFTEGENAIICDYLQLFTDNWSAHGQPLKTSFQVVYEQFIVLAADESFHAPSGCSIDESVHAMQEIEKRLGVALFDRSQVAFKTHEGIVLVSLAELKQKQLDGVWDESTPAFNNLISLKNQLSNQWIVPAGTTWLKRYLKGSTVTQ